jgi:hypothetical protein
MIEGKLENHWQARSWKPKRELKYNQQKKLGLNTEILKRSSASGCTTT